MKEPAATAIDSYLTTSTLTWLVCFLPDDSSIVVAAVQEAGEMRLSGPALSENGPDLPLSLSARRCLRRSVAHVLASLLAGRAEIGLGVLRQNLIPFS